MDEAIQSLSQAVLMRSLGVRLHDNDPLLLEMSDALYRKIMAMPTLLRTAMVILVHVFNYSGLVLALRSFCDQSKEQRLVHIGQWKDSPLGPCREFIAFIEKMTVFIYFSLCPDKN